MSGEAAPELVQMVGDVGGEIGPGAVRALERPVDLVAVGGRAEQQLRHRLPVSHRACRPWAAAACRCRAAPCSSSTASASSIRPAVDQLALRGEHVVAARPARRGRRGSAPSSPRRRCARTAGSHSGSPPSRQRSPSRAAIACRQRTQIVAGIEAWRDLADRLAQRLAVAQVQRAGERLDLRAAVVDVILAGDREAGMRQDAGQRVAEHRAAAMADMQRAGRIGRAELDIDPAAARRACCGRSRRRPRARSAPAAARRPAPCVRLTKPGRRAATPATSGAPASASTSWPARSPSAACRAALASTRAALVAASPCAAIARRLDRDPRRDRARPAARRRPAGSPIAASTRSSSSANGFMSGPGCSLNRRSCSSSA